MSANTILNVCFTEEKYFPWNPGTLISNKISPTAPGKFGPFRLFNIIFGFVLVVTEYSVYLLYHLSIIVYILFL